MVTRTKTSVAVKCIRVHRGACAARAVSHRHVAFRGGDQRQPPAAQPSREQTRGAGRRSRSGQRRREQRPVTTQEQDEVTCWPSPEPFRDTEERAGPDASRALAVPAPRGPAAPTRQQGLGRGGLACTRRLGLSPQPHWHGTRELPSLPSTLGDSPSKRSSSPSNPRRSWANVVGKGPESKDFRLRGPHTISVTLLSSVLVVQKPPETTHEGTSVAVSQQSFMCRSRCWGRPACRPGCHPGLR